MTQESQETRKRALISVFSKDGVVDLAQALVDLGWEIVSTGGTADEINAAGIDVTPISEVTGLPNEVLGGRLKTLHPAVLAGLLAKDNESDREDMAEFDWSFFDLVVVNLYNFQETVRKEGVTYSQAVEKIDIGGPTMIRAAGKSHGRVPVICDPADYKEVLAQIKATGQVSAEFRQSLAIKVFRTTAAFDEAVANYLEAMTAQGSLKL